jgi:diguanylate cyclase (GGDEF)-like protein/PAS domain S-box-containing protein
VARKQLEEALQESDQQLRAMFEHANVGIAISGLDQRYMRVNDKYCSIVGYSRDELMLMQVSTVNLDENVESMLQKRELLLHQDAPRTTTEKQLVRKDGTLVWVSIALSVVRTSAGAPLYYLAIIQDISEAKRVAAALKASEESFRLLAQHDTLTGLPNRALYYDRLQHALAQATRNDHSLGVLFIDVDRFKYVNDTYGHAAGDELLKLASERLSHSIRNDDTCARLGGDEFAIVLSRLASSEDATQVAAKIVQEFRRPFQLAATAITVSVSIGISLFPGGGHDAQTLMQNADAAMYEAKQQGRNMYQVYTA